MPRQDELVETRPTGNGRARGLVSSRESGRRVEARTYAVPKDLADVCSVFWMGHWDLRGQEPHHTELLGDPCVNLVFEQGGAHAGSRVVGVWTRLWRRTLEGAGRVRGVKLRAGAVRAFLDVPAVHLANRIAPLQSFFGAPVDQLERDALAPEAELAGLKRQLLDPEDDGRAFDAFASWLRKRRLADDRGDISLAVALVDRITAEPEITTVQELSEIAGMGVRPLQRLFRSHVGASPKWVIRRHRLQEVALRLERGERLTLAALAAELSYTDQAHLARDFKNATGRSPSEFATTVHR
jgi:AraC-like DNA-binding protein